MNKCQKALNTISDALTYYMVRRDKSLVHSDNEIYDAMATLRELTIKADSFKWIPFVTKSNELASELPLQYEVILVTDGKKVWTDLWMGIGGCFGLSSGTHLVGLAWMSMPELYKEKENE